MRAKVSLFAGVWLCLAWSAFAQPATANYDESKVGTYKLPDPLIFNDGKPVKSKRDWVNRRRGEILELFATDVYGHSPLPPSKLEYEVFDNDESALGGKAIRKQLAIFFSDKDHSKRENVLMYLPPQAKSKPVPVLLYINFNGNQTITTDPAVKLPTLWAQRTHEPAIAAETTRGRSKEFDLNKILEHGFGIVTVCYSDIEPDFSGGLPHGIRPLFYKAGQTEPSPGDWAAIGAWSYGLSRVLDYLEKDRMVDAKRVGLVGLSRLGKTVLWSGAMDERFALVISHLSGEGGAALSRRNYGETVRNLNTSFPYWFTSTYNKYSDDPSTLPVDSHELIALMAPRPVLITGAEEDKWADPRGMFLAAVAAGPVYRLLGKDDLGTTEMPELNKPIMHTIGYYYRTGKHELTSYDWDQFLAFADMHLKR